MACFGPLATTVASTGGAKATATFVFPVFGDVTAVLVYLSSVEVFNFSISRQLNFWEIRNNKSVEQRRAAPYVVGLLNCVLWFLYGLPQQVHTIHSNIMLMINCFGVIMMVTYLSIFLNFCNEDRRCMLSYFLIVEGIILICLGALVFTVAPEQEDKARLLGVSAVIAACCMYVTPVMDMVTVCTSKNVESAPISVLVTGASLLNAIAWTVYSSITLNTYVLIPNGVGVLIPVVQFIVYYKYSKAPAARNANRGN